MVFKRIIYYSVIFVIIFSSCTFQKRSFRKGYYVNYNSSTPKTKKQKVSHIKQVTKSSVTSVDEETLMASNDKTIYLRTKKNNKDSVKSSLCSDSIWLKNGSLITGKVVRKGPYSLRIKSCGSEDKSSIKVYRIETNKIKYYREKPLPTKILSSGWANASFLFAILALFFILILLAISINPTAFSMVLWGGWAYYFLFPASVFAILGGIFSVFSLIKIKKDPQHNIGKFKALFALLVAACFAGFFLLVLLSGL